ncbi:MAG: acyltransferase [Bacteroidetes bacterium]|nr:acyltransferase [Bacteroidota bacterium]
MQEKSKVFFPSLDGLRFLAFMFVFLSHSLGRFIEGHLSGNALLDDPLLFIFANGKMGVSVFFVLSGFLITYLILTEINTFKKLDVVSFYKRRFLRIWPLYYAILIFAFILFPFFQSYFAGLQDYSNPLYYVFFLSNFDVIRLQEAGLFQNLFLAVTWSIAIEEQFYLVWPLLFYFIPLRFYKGIFIGILAASLVFIFLNIHRERALHFHTFSAVFELASGGLAAYYAIHSKRFVSFFGQLPHSKRILVYISGILLLVFRNTLFSFEYGFILKKIISVLYFAFVILDQNFSTSPQLKLSASAFMSKWGKYTYGLYLLHTIALLVVAKIFIVAGAPTEKNALITIAYAFISLLLSFLLAWLSYTYFEKHFLKLKARFSYITKE